MKAQTWWHAKTISHYDSHKKIWSQTIRVIYSLQTKIVSTETGNTSYNGATVVCDTNSHTIMNAMHILKHMGGKVFPRKIVLV